MHRDTRAASGVYHLKAARLFWRRVLRKTGLVHIYYGEGKGKTTAALGVALRALANRFSVAILQFLKNSNRYGELMFFENKIFSEKFPEKILLRRLGSGCRHPSKKLCDACADCHIDPNNPDIKEISAAKKGLNLAESILSSGKYNLVVLDEILYALSFKLLDVNDVVNTLKKRHKTVETILTGGGFFKPLFECADYITEMRNRKHHYEKNKSSILSLDY